MCLHLIYPPLQVKPHEVSQEISKAVEYQPFRVAHQDLEEPTHNKVGMETQIITFTSNLPFHCEALVHLGPSHNGWSLLSVW